MTYAEALAFLEGHVGYLGTHAMLSTPEGRAYHEKFKAAVEAVKDPHATHWDALCEACEKIGKALPAGSEAAYQLCQAIDRLTAQLMEEDAR